MPSANFLLWIISGLYLLMMVWFLLLSPVGGYGTPEGQPWLVSAVIVFTASYGILMWLLWPHEEDQGGSFHDHPDKSDPPAQRTHPGLVGTPGSPLS
jgi:hypothetical protein